MSSKEEIIKLVKDKCGDKVYVFNDKGGLTINIESNKGMELQMYFEGRYLQFYIFIYSTWHKLDYIPIDNFSEQKFDEILIQIYNIRTAFHMLEQIMKGME